MFTAQGPGIYNPRKIKLNEQIRYERQRDMVLQFRDFDSYDDLEAFLDKNPDWEPTGGPQAA